MPGSFHQVTALVLDRREQGERYWRFHLLEPETGAIDALWRRSTRSHAPAPPDLYQEIEATLEVSARSKALFFREFRVLESHGEMARHYRALAEAGQFTRMLWRNLTHAEQVAPVYTLCREALGAFACGIRPEVVHFKALYRFAKEEGYPVKEEWWANLPVEVQPEVVGLVQKPVDAATVSEPTARAHLASLQRYLQAFSEIIIPSQSSSS